VLAGMLQSPVVEKDLADFGAAVAQGKLTLRDAAAKIAQDFLKAQT
jgi:hypothetical protein